MTSLSPCRPARLRSPLRRARIALLLTAAFLLPASLARAQQVIPFEQETLSNGLHVIYAPLHQAPVVHVRVLYHVGSRDERADRQGFAHMFEHMMFRGSAHVAPEEHMKLVNMVGGMSNAFTSFDETVYVNTVPSNYLDMVLYLEADRMSSFKVSDQIYKIERNVVAKEWGIRQNQPYGTLFEDFLKNAFVKHPYRWTPIGNMDDLKRAPVSELQQFFNTYYVPNNATLVIAGDIDIAKTKEIVHRYFGWIQEGGKIPRNIPEEPKQTKPREVTDYKVVPLPVVLIGWHTTDYRSPDQDVLNVLASILGDGRSSRLDQALVNSEHPVAASADSSNWQLEDTSVFTVSARLLPGRKAAEVEKELRAAVQNLIDKGVTADELAKVKQQTKIGLIRSRETAESIASQLGQEAVFGGDANRVNTELERIDRITPADVQRVAKEYLTPNGSTTMLVVPDPTGLAQRKAAATQVASVASTPVVPSTQPVEPRVVKFPADYPTKPPIGDPSAPVTFAKGVESVVNGVKVIVMSDHRLPLVNWSLTIRRGSHVEPKGQEGLGAMTASMLRRGCADLNYEQLNKDLESRGITLSVSDGGDFTRLFGSTTTDQLDHGILRSHQVLLQPTFPADELAKLKQQEEASLRSALADPGSACDRDLNEAIYGDSPLGRDITFNSLKSITLDDIKKYYHEVYKPEDAFLVIAGDITEQRGREIAAQLLDGWNTSGELPNADYHLPPAPAKRKIILIDNPEGRQSVVRLAIRGYTVHSEDRFPGNVAGQILSSGIESRLQKYIRAEKGYAYYAVAYFRPGRQSGTFAGMTETAFETTGPAVEAMFKVFDDMKDAPVKPEELQYAKMRVNGSMVMGLQTIQQQADMRGTGILNGYPVDYYDRFPALIGKVTADQVEDVMKKYVDENKMVVMVAAPAEKVKAQLEKLGDVEVLPMPLNRPGMAPTTQPSEEMLQTAK